MRIIVTGCEGMVGHAIKEVFKDHDLFLTDIGSLDVRKYNYVSAITALKPNLIIHLAAETDLEACEQCTDHAYRTNTIGTINMRVVAERLQIPIVYISTAGVFDGLKKGAYLEWDTPNPINNYGRSKYYGEIALKGYEKAWIFRAGWMMGGGPSIDKKFINKVYSLIQKGDELIYGIDDIYGSPTYTYDLAKTIKKVIDAGAGYGLYHCVGKGRASRYDVAKLMVETLDLPVTVAPVYGNYFRKDFPCQRSKNEELKNYKLDVLGLSCMRHWKDTVVEYVKKEYKEKKA